MERMIKYEPNTMRAKQNINSGKNRGITWTISEYLEVAISRLKTERGKIKTAMPVRMVAREVLFSAKRS